MAETVHVHKVPQRADWEKILDTIFTEVIEEWKNGIAVISNTRNGNIMPNHVNVSRVSTKLEPELRQYINNNMDSSMFKTIYHLAVNQVPEVYDCYVIKGKLGLPVNSLVFMIEQKKGIISESFSSLTGSAGSKRKRAIIIFGKAYRRDELWKFLKTIDKILTGEIKPKLSNERKNIEKESKISDGKKSTARRTTAPLSKRRNYDSSAADKETEALIQKLLLSPRKINSLTMGEISEVLMYLEDSDNLKAGEKGLIRSLNHRWSNLNKQKHS